MDMTDYRPRLADKMLVELLDSSGAVLVEGPKWCGKTWTAMHAAGSVVELQDPDRRTSYLRMADTKPSLLLEGAVPHLIDEWQDAPVLWDAVRHAVDHRSGTGQFILTGSVTPPAEGEVMHSGAGRIARLRMRPMTLYESGESTGAVSLMDLFDGRTDIGALSPLTVEQLAYAVCRGGWPAAVSRPEKAALRMVYNYLETVVRMEVRKPDGVEKNPERVRLLLRSLARNVSTMASNRTILSDLEATDTTLSDKTLAQYMKALRNIFVVEDIPAWQPSIRSKTAIRTSAKRGFADPSIAAAALRLTPVSLLRDFETFGFLFEALCARDLRTYAEADDGDIFHYRDKSGLEVDLIVRLADGRWGAVEVKMGNREAEEGAAHLKALGALVDSGRMREPSFLMVLTAGEYAYRREDGVLVVPIGCLKP